MAVDSDILCRVGGQKSTFALCFERILVSLVNLGMRLALWLLANLPQAGVFVCHGSLRSHSKGCFAFVFAFAFAYACSRETGRHETTGPYVLDRSQLPAWLYG